MANATLSFLSGPYCSIAQYMVQQAYCSIAQYMMQQRSAERCCGLLNSKSFDASLRQQHVAGGCNCCKDMPCCNPNASIVQACSNSMSP